MRLTYDEWDALLVVAEVEDASAAELLRAFIIRRRDELEHPEMRDWYAAADALSELSRRVRAMVDRVRSTK